MKEIKIDNRVALVDDEDFEFLNRLSWKISKIAGKEYPSHFMQSTKQRVTAIGMHYFLMDTKQNHIIHHRDWDPWNNQKTNLMHLSFRLMRAGSKPKARESSKYKGVSWNAKQQVWRVQCGDKFLGNFKSEQEAAKAYDIEAYNQYEEFAYQNFPEATDVRVIEKIRAKTKLKSKLAHKSKSGA